MRKNREANKEKSFLGVPTGFNNNFIEENVPKLRETNSQVVQKGKNNSFIVLKRDQSGSRSSGAGGKGMTSCGAIDIIAGLDSANGPSKNEVDPNFFNDASRIYLTQKGKIDNYFGLAKGSSIGEERYSSGIGIKSDKVNMIAREGIKIVTGKARVNGQERNSGGGGFTGIGSIDLIAGNFTGTSEAGSFNNMGIKGGSSVRKTLQPLLKGDNTAKLLEEIIDKLTDLNNMIYQNRVSLIKIGQSYVSHSHVGVCAVGPVVVPPSPMAATAVEPIVNSFVKISENVTTSVNDAIKKVNYLDPNFPEYIKSKGVKST